MAAALRGALAGAKSFDSSSPVRLTFKLTNRGKDDQYVLKWNTPLEGLNSDCLKITRNGRTRVAYDGPLIKRGVPGPEDYVLVPAGKSIAVDVNVSESYPVSHPAKYEVELRVQDLRHLPAERPDRGVRKLVRTRKPPLKLSLEGGGTEFHVRKGYGPVLTRGQAARTTSRRLAKPAKKKSRSGAARAAVAPLPPKFIGGTKTQRADTRRAHRNGFDLCAGALRDLSNDSHYEEWFGTYSASRLAKVKVAYTRITTRMSSTTFTYNLSGEGCRSGVYGYTYKKSATIWLCGAFWNAPDTGTDSKAGTMVHEHSHCDAEANDLAYGQTNSRALAKDSPSKAIKNADNFEYFAES